MAEVEMSGHKGKSTSLEFFENFDITVYSRNTKKVMATVFKVRTDRRFINV